MKKLNDDYEVADSKKEVKELAQKHGIAIEKFYETTCDFYSPSITIGGETPPEHSSVRELWKDIRVAGHKPYEECKRDWAGVSEEIPGLFCPNCQSQAFYTDHKNVAVCGGCPGWYFFYKRLDNQVKPSTKIIIRNGEMVEVTDAQAEESTI